MSYNDPTVLHSAECQRCGTVYRDGDVLDMHGNCPSCVEEIASESDATEDDDAYPFVADDSRYEGMTQ